MTSYQRKQTFDVSLRQPDEAIQGMSSPLLMARTTHSHWHQVDKVLIGFSSAAINWMSWLPVGSFFCSLIPPEGDVRFSDRTGGSHVVECRDRWELTLERSGDGRCHSVGIRPGQRSLNVYRRVLDIRQERSGPECKADMNALRKSGKPGTRSAYCGPLLWKIPFAV
jgi:hypothetical protein